MHSFGNLSVSRSFGAALLLVADLAGCAGAALKGEWRQPSPDRSSDASEPEDGDEDGEPGQSDRIRADADAGSDNLDGGPSDAAVVACDACMRDE